MTDSLFDDEWLTDDDEPISFILYNEKQIIDAAYDYYRKTGFPYRNLPLHICMQELNKLAAMKVNDKLLTSNLGYHIADTYHPHRFHAAATGKTSPYESFMDTNPRTCGRDKLRIALELVMESTQRIGTGYLGPFSLVRGTQACSNFRPAFARYLYDTYAKPGDTVLDTSTGYGGRLIGFLASKMGAYIGIDPNVPTHKGNIKMAQDLNAAERVFLINKPAEDVNIDDDVFSVDNETYFEGLDEECDFAFTSPPYFAKERYSYDDTQSWVRYQTPEKWRDNFLYKMLRLQFDALKPNSYNIVNIAAVNVKNKTVPLDEWTKDIAQDIGFEYIETRQFTMSSRFGANQEDEVAFEPVLIFKKGE